MNNNTPSSFSREKAIKALTSLELSLGEAKIYTWLVGEGPTHASTIASEADVLQPKVYGYLKDLVKRTFVIRQEKEGTPDTFIVGLSTSAYTPDRSAHEALADITNELAGNGYARQTLANVALTEPTLGTWRFDCDDPVFYKLVGKLLGY